MKTPRGSLELSKPYQNPGSQVMPSVTGSMPIPRLRAHPQALRPSPGSTPIARQGTVGTTESSRTLTPAGRPRPGVFASQADPGAHSPHEGHKHHLGPIMGLWELQ